MKRKRDTRFPFRKGPCFQPSIIHGLFQYAFPGTGYPETCQASNAQVRPYWYRILPYCSPKPQHNLPVQLTTFIGRDKEITIVTDLISEHRLVTLTGVGGCGKTRLACEVSSQPIGEYEDGVWFVDFSPISTKEMVAREVMEVLGISEEPDKSIVGLP